MKLLLVIIVGVLMLLIIIPTIMVYVVRRKHLSKTKEDLLTYIEEHRDACSVTLLENKSKLLTFNEDKEMPLASTVKLIYLFTLVEAVKEKKVVLDKKVKVEDLDVLYFENTDGGAHPRWKTENNIGDEVNLFQIAQGMMQFSSNACTDFLFHELGADRINHTLTKYSLHPHSAIYAFSSAMLIPAYLKVEYGWKKAQMVQTIKEMNQNEFENLSNMMLHNVLNKKAGPYLKELSTINDMTVQRVLMDKLPSSTTEQYAAFMMRTGESDDLSDDDKELVDRILGRANESGKRRWFKGGSTAFTLTSAIYQTDGQESAALSVFVQDEKRYELLWIRKVFHDFLNAMVEDGEFREKAISKLGNTE
ncbi:D-alanyl-D-alanine carboxypeptidase [Salibacterium qingdaonense]|uniref:D-alanyl-D-alanine carboxypeptidase n=2 Tax=Salibacterium qingdaonense TaxID=266892 RepID=A0A1I4N6V0_9BACI|nr:D-alanyl-D-alanine carboxypeptidase [Salibacterium qingdaonense]